MDCDVSTALLVGGWWFVGGIAGLAGCLSLYLLGCRVSICKLKMRE